nr:unnamed protein product [Callosobruchus analis]
MGQYFASVSHLYELLSQFSKDKHLLTPSDLKAEDKMNYDAAKRMCSTNVIQLLEKIPNTEGTVLYLKLMNAVTTAFIEEDVSVYERLHSIWYCAFFMRMWRADVTKKAGFTLKDNFISSNSYTCSVKVSGTEVGPDDGQIVCVCAWYGVVKTEEKFTLSPTTSPEFFISLKHYKCTLPHPDYETNDDKILLVYKENIINDISRLTNTAPERSCHKDATESDLKNANSDKTNLLLPVKLQITPQITNDQEHTSEAEKKYIGRIVQVDLDTKKAKVNFLKQKQSSLHFIWPEMEDVDDAPVYQMALVAGVGSEIQGEKDIKFGEWFRIGNSEENCKK